MDPSVHCVKPNLWWFNFGLNNNQYNEGPRRMMELLRLSKPFMSCREKTSYIFYPVYRLKPQVETQHLFVLYFCTFVL